MPPLALYVHVPFCQTKCPYCDFNTYAGIESLMPSYVGAIEHEAAQWGAWLGRPRLTSIFFGGGTPSYLPTRDLTRLMRAIAAAFDIAPDAESTAEANPGDCTRERLQVMRRIGFNRISIGVQSFDDRELELLGRRHSAEHAKRAVDAARKAGFENLSLDLMFGLPYQFASTWEHTLEEAIALEPDHLSAYALTLEGGTPMEADVRSRRLPEPDPDLVAEMYQAAQRALAAAGYEQYEISNWAKPGRASNHNLAYWRSECYLGIGPAAHSYLFANGEPALDALGPHGVRFSDVRPPRTYIDSANAWHAKGPLTPQDILAVGPVDSTEELPEATAMGDVMMMGLRLNPGVADDAFRARFGVGIAEAFPGAVRECRDLGLVEWAGGALRLTDEGRLLGNEAFERFVAAAQA